MKYNKFLMITFLFLGTQVKAMDPDREPDPTNVFSGHLSALDIGIQDAACDFLECKPRTAWRYFGANIYRFGGFIGVTFEEAVDLSPLFLPHNQPPGHQHED